MHHEHGTKPGFDLLRMWRMKFTSAAPVVLGFRETVLHYGIGMVKYSQNMSALQPFFFPKTLLRFQLSATQMPGKKAPRQLAI
jgi:hypothetical protein